jgi:hypothetical protein
MLIGGARRAGASAWAPRRACDAARVAELQLVAGAAGGGGERFRNSNVELITLPQATSSVAERGD